MLSDSDRVVIWHCRNAGISTNALSLYFQRTPQHIRAIFRSTKPFPEASSEMYFRLGVRAEQVARVLQLPAACNRKEAETQSLPMDEMPWTSFTMADVTQCSLAKRQHVRERRHQRAERLMKTREGLRVSAQEELTPEEEIAEQDPENSQLADADLSFRLLENFKLNLGRDRRGWRFSSDILDFGYVVSRYSMAAYNILRTILPLPSRQILSSKFKNVEKMLAKMYESEDLCHALLTRYFERVPMTSHDTEIQCTLSIDAFSINVFRKHIREIREVSEKLPTNPDDSRGLKEQVLAMLDNADEALDDVDEKEEGHVDCEEKRRIVQCEFNNCFLVMLVPFQWTRPPVTISVFPASSGSANGDILQRIFRIVDICSQYNIRIRTIATDGDPGYSCLHSTVYNLWKDARKKDFETILTIFQRVRNVPLVLSGQKWRSVKLSAIPIADPLHALKVARSRVLDKTVFLTPNSHWSVSQEDFRAFEKEIWFTDRRQIARMCDYHALEMFSPRVLRQLIEIGSYSAVVYSWGWTALMLAIRVPYLSLETRQSLLISSFSMFIMFLNQVLDKAYQGTGVVVRFHEGCDGVTFFETGYLYRVIHLIFAMFTELATNGKRLRMSAFGTHANENAIGRARVSTGGVNTFEVFKQHFARSELCRHLEHSLGIRKPVRTRDNIGGAKLDMDDSADLLVDLDVSGHTQTLLQGFAESNDTKFAQGLTGIASFLDKILKRSDEMPKIYPPNKAANSGIISRLLEFQ